MTAAPPAAALSTCSARRAKSAERIEGASSINLGSLKPGILLILSLYECRVLGHNPKCPTRGRAPSPVHRGEAPKGFHPVVAAPYSKLNQCYPHPTRMLPIVYSLISVLCWGTSDFTGGYASKRSDAFLITVCAHLSGSALMLTSALVTHAPVPDRASQLWALLAGTMGGTALAIFYRTLAGGKMGLTAPVAALIGAAIPTAFGMMTEGIPGKLPIVGFLLAAAGIWLISRPEERLPILSNGQPRTAGDRKRPEGIATAVLCGVGFAGFMLAINQVGNSSVVWSAAYSRLASFVVVGLIVLARRQPIRLDRRDALLALLAGAIDVTGTALFIRADQTGRLDSAVVITSFYPAVTVILARLILKEHFHRWRALGILASLVAVPLIALQ